MKYVRGYCLLCVSLVAAVLAASCTSTHDNADVVPAQPGAFQPDAGGALIDEATACAALTKAESKARAALSCDAVERDCPSYIRPAGGEGCFVYDQASLDGCSTLYTSFTSCDDFDRHPCVLTAESKCDAAGEGGASGLGGASGVSGAGGASAGAGGVADVGMGGASAAGFGG
jgi:hypothetical protein